MTDVQTTAGELRDDEPARPGSNRRLVLLGAGAVGATAVLAACGTSNGPSNTTGTDFTNNPAPAGSGAADAGGGSGSTGGATAGGAAKTLAAKADVPSGGGIIAGDYVITQPTAGQFKAFSKVCTHAGCDVNKIDSGIISCPCHGSQYSIETGEPTRGPATKPLPETKVKVDGNNIVTA
jgi:Rieske Fe-S protein